MIKIFVNKKKELFKKNHLGFSGKYYVWQVLSMQMSVSVIWEKETLYRRKDYWRVTIHMSVSESYAESESVFTTDNEDDDLIQQAEELSRGPSCLSGMLEISRST